MSIHGFPELTSVFHVYKISHLHTNTACIHSYYGNIKCHISLTNPVSSEIWYILGIRASKKCHISPANPVSSEIWYVLGITATKKFHISPINTVPLEIWYVHDILGQARNATFLCILLFMKCHILTIASGRILGEQEVT